MCFSTEVRSTSSRSAWRTERSPNRGCRVLALERSPSTSVQGSVLLSSMCSILPPGTISTRPLALPPDEIPRLEIDKPVGAGPDRLQVCRCLARATAAVGLEQMLRDDHSALADKRVRPERRRLCEMYPNSERIDFFDLDVLIAADRRGRRRRVRGVFPVEYDVVGGERLAIVPLDALLELPG